MKEVTGGLAGIFGTVFRSGITKVDWLPKTVCDKDPKKCGDEVELPPRPISFW
jgi:hypothetical protein